MQIPARELPPLHGECLEEVELNESRAWWLRFTGHVALYIPNLWRLTEGGNICATSEDHNQLFGLERPFDAREVLQRLFNVPILKAEVTAGTTDLVVTFANDLSLQVLTTSVGYEGWSLLVTGRHRFIARGAELLEVSSDA
jgi:hypothetical protein